MSAAEKLDDAFTNGVLSCLAVVHSHGDAGGHMYTEMLNMAGRERVIAYARKSGEMEWSGLRAHLAIERSESR